MIIPHDHSANYYDFVYERRYGKRYQELTRNNIKKIQEFAPNGKILDFGAGTGRISIPLAKEGYKVTSVDCSSEMLKVLRSKAKIQNLNIDTYSELSEIVSKDFDMAISVFTVLAYITDKEELKKVFNQIYNSLKPGGVYMFDLERRAGYDQYLRTPNGIVIHQPNDLVTVKLKDDNLNLVDYYEESNGVLLNGIPFNYRESFTIKFWTIEEICSIIKQIGFTEIERFLESNTEYFIVKKI